MNKPLMNNQMNKVQITDDSATIYKNIDDHGYHILNDFISEQQINIIKSALLSMLQYIKPDDITDLNEKYYQIQKEHPVLLSHFYDLLPSEINTLQTFYSPVFIDLIKGYFKTDVLLSARPAIHIHDSTNVRFLVPHQETHQFSTDFLFIWLPLDDTNYELGRLAIYKDSHKDGYCTHHLDNQLGSSHIKTDIVERYERYEIDIPAGSAALVHSALIHGSCQNRKKDHVRWILSDRYCPLQKLPFLKEENAERKIPYMEPHLKDLDYNAIVD